MYVLMSLILADWFRVFLVNKSSPLAQFSIDYEEIDDDDDENQQQQQQQQQQQNNNHQQQQQSWNSQQKKSK